MHKVKRNLLGRVHMHRQDSYVTKGYQIKVNILKKYIAYVKYLALDWIAGPSR